MENTESLSNDALSTNVLLIKVFALIVHFSLDFFCVFRVCICLSLKRSRLRIVAPGLLHTDHDACMCVYVYVYVCVCVCGCA